MGNVSISFPRSKTYLTHGSQTSQMQFASCQPSSQRCLAHSKQAGARIRQAPGLEAWLKSRTTCTSAERALASSCKIRFEKSYPTTNLLANETCKISNLPGLVPLADVKMTQHVHEPICVSTMDMSEIDCLTCFRDRESSSCSGAKDTASTQRAQPLSPVRQASRFWKFTKLLKTPKHEYCIGVQELPTATCRRIF